MTLCEQLAPGTVREVTLTEEEILTVVGLAAGEKARMTGEYRNAIQFTIVGSRVTGAVVKVTQLAPGESGVSPVFFGGIGKSIGRADP